MYNEYFKCYRKEITRVNGYSVFTKGRLHIFGGLYHVEIDCMIVLE